MEYSRFKEVIDAIREIDNFIDRAGNIGVSMIDSPLYNAMPKLYEPFFVDNFGEEGLEWISWYLYELPSIAKMEGSDSGHSYAAYEDGTPIDVSSDESFFEFLDSNYGNKKRE